MTFVHIGCFDHFRPGKTLLLAGDSSGMLLLAESFDRIASDNMSTTALHLMPFVKVHRGLKLQMSCVLHDIGLSLTGDVFCWQRNQNGWKDAANRTRQVSAVSSGHHYLDAEHDDIMVMVSSGEYPEAWWDSNA